MIELKVLLCASAEHPWLKKDTEQTQRLERCFEDFKYIYCEQNLVSLQDVKKADIVIGRLPVELIPQAQNLKWLHLASADVRGYDKADLYVNDFAILTGDKPFVAPDDAMETVLVLMEQYLGGGDLDNEIPLGAGPLA